MKFRGQVELEFISLLGLVLLLFVVINFFAFQNRSNSELIREEVFAKNLCDTLALEINYAVAIGNGYEKNITLPALLGDKVDYGIDFDPLEKAVIVTWNRGSCRSSVNAVINGFFEIGLNTISNKNGEILIS